MKTFLNVFHMDMNYVASRPAVIREMIHFAAENGYNAILWEVENKIQWKTCPSAVDPEAMTIAEFRAILQESRELGLEPIPLLQTIGHGEYIMMHPEYTALRELPERYDCYCVSKPETRDFLKAMIREYKEVFGELKYFHLGGDEAYVFGQCPVCSRRDRGELYAEHIQELAEAELIPHGIRPCIWNDMIMHYPQAIPASFLIWDWNYGDGLEPRDGKEPFASVKILRDLGFDVVLCSASRSVGDSYFLPFWKRHSVNIAGAAEKVRKEELYGYCLTCWAIRLVPMELQKPYIVLGSRVLNGADPYEAMDAVAKEYWNLSPEDVEKISAWEGAAGIFSGGQWNGLKDSVMPPPGHVQRKLEWIAATPEGAEMKEYQAIHIPELLETLKAVRQKLTADTYFRKIFAKGLDLQIRYVAAVDKMILKQIKDEAFLAELYALKAESAAYYGEQMPVSAFHNASLVYDTLLEYCK